MLKIVLLVASESHNCAPLGKNPINILLMTKTEKHSSYFCLELEHFSRALFYSKYNLDKTSQDFNTWIWAKRLQTLLLLINK